MSTWTFVRFLHLTGVLFFVGGQLMLVVAVAPVLRGREDVMRQVARRFAVGTGVALAVAIATGIALASHFQKWDRPALQVKMMLLVLVATLIPLHAMSARTKVISLSIVAASLVMVWLGVKLSWG